MQMSSRGTINGPAHAKMLANMFPFLRCFNNTNREKIELSIWIPISKMSSRMEKAKS